MPTPPQIVSEGGKPGRNAALYWVYLRRFADARFERAFAAGRFGADFFGFLVLEAETAVVFACLKMLNGK